MTIKPLFEFIFNNNSIDDSIQKTKEILKSHNFINHSDVFLKKCDFFNISNDFYKLINFITVKQKNNEIDDLFIETYLSYNIIESIYKFLDIIKFMKLFTRLHFIIIYDISTNLQYFLQNLQKIKSKYFDIQITIKIRCNNEMCTNIINNINNIHQLLYHYNIEIEPDTKQIDTNIFYQSLQIINNIIPNFIKTYIFIKDILQKHEVYNFSNELYEYNLCGHLSTHNCLDNKCFECEIIKKYKHLNEIKNNVVITQNNYKEINDEYNKIQNDWNTMVSTIQPVNNFLSLIEQVKELSNDKEYASWIKWKDIYNQIVIKSDKFYYKIYQNDKRNGLYLAEIRNKLAEIYKNKFGIIWNIATLEQEHIVYQIEQREQLELCTPEKISFENIMLDWAETLEELEEILCFDEILLQIKHNPNFINIKKMKLLRECVNCYMDYAFTPDYKHIVLLDDSDFFITLLDENLQWKILSHEIINVTTTIGHLYFTAHDSNKLDKYENLVDKWNFLYYDENPEQQNLSFSSINTKMLNDNLYILTHKEIPQNLELYYKPLTDYWGNKASIDFSRELKLLKNPQ